MQSLIDNKQQLLEFIIDFFKTKRCRKKEVWRSIYTYVISK